MTQQQLALSRDWADFPHEKNQFLHTLQLMETDLYQLRNDSQNFFSYFFNIPPGTTFLQTKRNLENHMSTFLGLQRISDVAQHNEQVKSMRFLDTAVETIIKFGSMVIDYRRIRSRYSIVRNRERMAQLKEFILEVESRLMDLKLHYITPLAYFFMNPDVSYEDPSNRFFIALVDYDKYITEKEGNLPINNANNRVVIEMIKKIYRESYLPRFRKQNK